MKFNWVQWLISGILGILSLFFLLRNSSNPEILAKIETTCFNDYKSLIPNSEQLSILSKGEKYDEPCWSKIRLENTGNVVFSKEDFISGGIFLSDTSGSQILSASILDFYPRNSLFSFNSDSSGMTLLPELLNPEEWIEIQITSNGNVPNFDIQGRIVGLSEIIRVQPKNQVPPNHDILLWGLSVTVFIMGFFIFPATEPERILHPKLASRKYPILIFKMMSYLGLLAITILVSTDLVYRAIWDTPTSTILLYHVGMAFMTSILFSLFIMIRAPYGEEI